MLQRDPGQDVATETTGWIAAARGANLGAMLTRLSLILAAALATGCASSLPTRFGPVDAPDCELAEHYARAYVTGVARLLAERPQTTPPVGLRVATSWDGDPRHWARVLPTEAGPLVEVRHEDEPRPGVVAEGLGLALDGPWDRLPVFARRGLGYWASALGSTEVDRELRMRCAVRGARSLALTVQLDRKHERDRGAGEAEVIPMKSYRGSARHALPIEVLFERERFHDGTDVLGWLLVERIVRFRGLDGLEALCHEAVEAGREQVRAEELALAARLDFDRGSWAVALTEMVLPLDPITVAKELNVPRDAWSLEGAEAVADLVLRFSR